jgi:hypothetical protein
LLAYLILSAIQIVLQLFELPAQDAHFVLRRLDTLRQIEQALVREHALDAQQAAVELRHTLHDRILLRGRGAAGERGADRKC